MQSAIPVATNPVSITAARRPRGPNAQKCSSSSGATVLYSAQPIETCGAAPRARRFFHVRALGAGTCARAARSNERARVLHMHVRMGPAMRGPLCESALTESRVRARARRTPHAARASVDSVCGLDASKS